MSSKFKGLYDTLEIQLRNIYSYNRVLHIDAMLEAMNHFVEKDDKDAVETIVSSNTDNVKDMLLGKHNEYINFQLSDSVTFRFISIL